MPSRNKYWSSPLESFIYRAASLLQGIQAFTGQAVATSLSASLYYASAQIGNITVKLATSDADLEVGYAQMFAVGMSASGRSRSAAIVAAEEQAHFVVKLVSNSGITLTQSKPCTKDYRFTRESSIQPPQNKQKSIEGIFC